MSFNWSEYLKLAQELAGQTASPASQEARLRAAISRTYYAVFCKSRNYLRDEEGRQIPSRDVHRYVRDAFKGSADRLRKQIGYDLDRLRNDRNKADYYEHKQRLLPERLGRNQGRGGRYALSTLSA